MDGVKKHIFSFTVYEGHEGAVLKNGKLDRIVGPGRHSLNPFGAYVIGIDKRIQEGRFSLDDVQTKDGIPINADLAVFYVVDNTEQFIRNIDTNPQPILETIAHSAHNMIISSRPYEEIVSKQDAYESFMYEIMRGRLDRHTPQVGISVSSVNLIKFKLPQVFEQSAQNIELAKRRLEEEQYLKRIKEVEAEKAAISMESVISSMDQLSKIPGGQLYAFLYQMSGYIPDVMDILRESVNERKEAREEFSKQLGNLTNELTHQHNELVLKFSEQLTQVHKHQDEIVRGIQLMAVNIKDAMLTMRERDMRSIEHNGEILSLPEKKGKK